MTGTGALGLHRYLLSVTKSYQLDVYKIYLFPYINIFGANSKEEVEAVFEELRNGKAPGHDNFKTEQIKYRRAEGEKS